MKKKQPTFSDRAKAIQRKYPRHTWDAIERKDMMKELEALKNEQEEMREAMGIADGADQMDEMEKKYGGKFDGFNTTQKLPADNPYGIPLNLAVNNSFSGVPNVDSSLVDNPYGNNTINLATNNNWSFPSSNKYNNDSVRSVTPSNAASYGVMTDSALPFLVSAGASAIGDIASLINMKRNMPKSVSLPRMSPAKVNMEPQRQALQRGYNTASNVMLRNSRDVSSPSNAYANQIAGLSALTDSVGTQMGQSYMNEANTNAQFAQSANAQNAQIGAQEELYNTQLQGQNAQMTGQYINSLANTIPSALRDYRQQVNQTNMLNIMGKDYGLYQKLNPNMNSWQKFVASLTGSPYSVLNRQNPYIV